MTLFLAFLLVNTVAAKSCDQGVVNIVSKTTDDAYVDLHHKLKSFNVGKGLFIQNEGKKTLNHACDFFLNIKCYSSIANAKGYDS